MFFHRFVNCIKKITVFFIKGFHLIFLVLEYYRWFAYFLIVTYIKKWITIKQYFNKHSSESCANCDKIIFKLFKKEIQNAESWQWKQKSLVGLNLREHQQDGVYAVSKIVLQPMVIEVTEAISGLEDDENCT